jgi:hypothetical protein
MPYSRKATMQDVEDYAGRVLINVCLIAYRRHRAKQWVRWGIVKTEAAAIEALQAGLISVPVPKGPCRYADVR